MKLDSYPPLPVFSVASGTPRSACSFARSFCAVFTRIVLSLALFVGLFSHSLGAAPLFTEDFSGITGGNFGAGQYQSNLDLNNGGNVPGWSKTGSGTVHAVDLANQYGNIVNPRNFALMVWQDNVITLDTGIAGSNVAGITYTIAYNASPCVYATSGQETAAGDGLLFEVLRADNTVLASHPYYPGVWTGNMVMVPDSFQYTGDGSGDIRIRIGPQTAPQTRFVGAVDDLMISEYAPKMLTQSPSTSVVAGGSLTMSVAATGAGTLSYQWRKRGTATVSTFAGHVNSPSSGNGTGIGAYFNNPRAIAVDQATGDAYVGDTDNGLIRRITPAGVVTTFLSGISYACGVAVGSDGFIYVTSWGSGTLSKATRAGVVSTVATFGSQLRGVAVDLGGNAYVVAEGDNAVYKVTSAGVVSVFAGGFNSPYGIAIDAAGNCYVADQLNHLIKKITPLGVVSVLAGGAPGALDGVGADAQFYYPNAITLDGAGNLYVADAGNHTVRKITPAGVVTTIVGQAGTSGTVDGLGASAQLGDPNGIALNASGDLYLNDTNHHTVRKITLGVPISGATGAIYTIPSAVAGDAGEYDCIVTGSGGNVTSVPTSVLVFNSAPAYTSVITGGSVTLSASAVGTGSLTYQWRKRGTSGVVTTFAGSGAAGSADGTGTAATFNSPNSIEVDAFGNLYVGEYWNNAIRKISPTGVVSTITGSVFNNPSVSAIDGMGNVYVSSGADSLRKVSPTGVVSLVSMVTLGGPCARDLAGNLYFGGGSAAVVYKVTPTGTLTTFAGAGATGNADGTGLAATFANPRGMVVDKRGDFYVADFDGNRIRKITSAGVVTTFAGSGAAGSTDGVGVAVTFDGPQGLALDVNGNLYVSECFNKRIRKITPAGVVTSFAGSGAAGSLDGTGAAASFGSLYFISADYAGNIWIADNDNNKIRKVSPGTNISGATGASYTLSGVSVGDAGDYDVVVTDSATGISWASPAASVLVAASATNVSFAQQNGTGIVDVSYDLSMSGPVGLLVSFDGGASFQSVNFLTGDVGLSVTAGTGKHIFWDAATARPNSSTSNLVVRVTPLLAGLGDTFAPIPGGTYQTGELSDDGDIGDAGTVSVTLSPYNMSAKDTTKAQWDAVRNWGLTNSYTDLAVGGGKASEHPVQIVSWYDVVKWANAASELEGLTPCYTVNGSVYRTGYFDNVVCDWSANGYRLPTEAEWEVAARGGLSGKRFPWGDTISQNQANYQSGNYTYDQSGPGVAYHPAYDDGVQPYTSPVGSFPSNGYGLNDMAGNVSQWCWDWYGPSYVAESDPRGPSTGTVHVWRGGNWGGNASDARSAKRYVDAPSQAHPYIGFRLARGAAAGVGAGVASPGGALDTVVPTIVVQPQGGSVVTGGSFTLSVVAGGTGAFGYQWSLNGSPVGGATSSSYAITNAGSGNSGTYTVVVSNIAGTLGSDSAVVIAGAGALDPAMSGDGVFSASWGGWDDIARSVVVQPDGKFLVFGDAFNASTYDFVVARYNTDGTADSSFNSNGRVWVDSGANDWASNVLLQPDGKILLVGYSNVVSNYSFYVVRLNSDGSLDSTFNGTGSVSVDISGDDYVQSATLQADGKILLGGFTGNANAPHTVLRLNPDGSVDSLFGTAGVAQLAIGNDHRSTGTLVQPDGKVILTGATNLGGAWNFSAVRFNSDGALDTTFNGSGAQYTSIGTSAVGNGGVLQPDGKIVIAGTATISGQSHVALTRYTSTGALDGTFGTGGVVTTAISSLNASVNAIAVQSDGKFVVTGDFSDQILTIRYNSNGALDGSFGVGGIVLTPFGLTAKGLAVTQNNEGRVLVVGAVNTNEQNYDFAVVQFDAGTFAPFIRMQPVGGALSVGGAMSLNVEVIGTPPLAYQWYLNGGAIGGATLSGYPIVSAGTANAGSYNVMVSNAYGSVSSGSVAVTVNGPPVILTQPTGGSIAAAGSFTLSVVASGAGTLGYQWYLNGGSIGGATLSSYPIVSAGTANAGSYNVIVSNAFGGVSSGTVMLAVAADTTPPVISGLVPVSVQATKPEGAVVTYPAAIATDGLTPSPAITYSYPSGSNFPVGVTIVTVTATDAAGNSATDTFTVTVTPMGTAPTITANPTGGLLLPGQSLSLSVSASGTEPLAYQWYLDTVSIRGANSGIYVATNPGIYRVVVTNSYGSIPSNDVVVTLAVAPSVVVQPAAAPVISGGSVTFAVNASGTGPFTYQWRLGATPIAGATGSTFTILPSHLGDAGQYTCVISGPGGSVTTEPFVSPLRITTQPQSQLFVSGGSLNLSVGGVGTVGAGSLSYQWYKDAQPLLGETSASYTKAATVSADSGAYSVTVGYGGLQLSSNVVSVSQGTPMLVLNPPDRVVVLSGGSATLSVSVLNEAVLLQKAVPLTYEWSYFGSVFPVTGGTLVLNQLTSAKAGDYQVKVTAAGYGSAYGSVLVQVADVNFTNQPLSAGVVLGGSASFSATAVAGGSVSYQWRKDTIDLPGETASVLAIRSVQFSDIGFYDVVATSGALSAVSQPASLEVLTPVVVDTAFFAKQGGTLDPGQRLDLSVSATGTEPLGFQWFKDGNAILGATLPTYSVGVVSALDAGTYSVLVKNVVNVAGVSSGGATVVVNQAPSAGVVAATVSNGTAGAVVPGATVTLSANVPAGTDATYLSYQWRRNNVRIDGATGNSLALGAVNSLAQEGFYDVVLTNTVGRVEWTGVQVSLNQRPVYLVSDLNPITVVSGSVLKWSGFVAGPSDQTLTYVWRKGDTIVPGANASILTLPSVSVSDAGAYTVTASNSFSSISSGSVNLNVIAAVGITSQPVGGVFNPGARATFTVGATGGGLLYQWLRGGQAISGATSPTFELLSVSAEDDVAAYPEAKLSVRVYNEDPVSKTVLSAVTSDPVSVTVRKPVQLTSVTPSQRQLVDLGATVVFNAVATGTDVKYQWRRNQTAIPGETRSSLSVIVAGAGNTGKYDVLVKNAVNEVLSEGVVVEVKASVLITEQPLSKTSNTGKSVLLSVAATGTEPLAYQWRKDGRDLLSGGNASMYVISSVSGGDEGVYEVVVSNGVGLPVTSNAVSVLVNDTLTITKQPQSPEPVLLGGAVKSLTLKVEAITTTTKALRYQWRKNGEAIENEISPSYTIAPVSELSRGRYDVLVSTGGSAVVSEEVRVEVYGALSVSVAPAGGYPEVTSAEILTLKAGVQGGGASLVYQWLRGVTPVGTGATLDVVPTEDLANYSVRVAIAGGTGSFGAVTSASVPVQLLKAAAITSGPEDVVAEAGSSAVFRVVATGGGQLNFKWERLRGSSWEAVAGADGAQFVLPAVTSLAEGEYRVVVSNARNSVTKSSKLVVRAADVITQQPVSQTVNPGDGASFEVKAKGVELNYQWYRVNASRNAEAINGATASILSVNGSSESAEYYVQVRHAFGVSLSENVKLEVRNPVKITKSPRGVGLDSGESATLFVKASGSEPLSYRWMNDGAVLPGETADTLTVRVQGNYRVEVKNAVGPAISETAVVTVTEPVTITVQPVKSTVVRVGDTVELAVVATGTPAEGASALSYQWYKATTEGERALNDGSGVSGAKTDRLRLTNVIGIVSKDDSGTSGSYFVKVQGRKGIRSGVASAVSELFVVSAPVITKQPGNAVLNGVGNATFSVDVEGTGPFTYEWREGDLALVNPQVEESGARLVIPVPTATEAAAKKGKLYSVKVTNAVGQALSGAAKLIVRNKAQTGALETSLPESPTIEVVDRGGSVTFSALSVVAVEGTKVAYQWFKDGVELSGQTSSAYTIVTVAKTDAGVYSRRVRLLVDAVGGDNDGAELERVTQAGTLLVINNGPVIGAVQSQSVRPSQAVLFAPVVKVVDSITGSLVPAPESGVTYEWTKNGAPISAGINASGVLSIGSAVESDAGTYSVRAVYQGVAGDAVSVELRVGAAIQVALRSNNGALVTSGGNGYALELGLRSKLSLEASASGGTGPYKYQWRFNGANIVGATKVRLEVPAVDLVHIGRYDVVVVGVTDRVTSGIVTLGVLQPFGITEQPVAKVAVNPGEGVELRVGVNRGDVTYQWLKGGGRSAQQLSNSATISGATSNVLRISAAQDGDTGSYSVLVTNRSGLGRLTSNSAKVFVNKPVKITRQPATVPRVLLPGEGASFDVLAEGTGTVSYQWYKGSVEIPGANANKLEINAVSLVDAGAYTVLVKNSLTPNGVRSSVATLSVTAPVVITKEPVDVQVARNGSGSGLLSVVASGGADGVLSYQWRRSGLAISGATQPELSVSRALTVFDAGYYDVLVTKSVGDKVVSRSVSRKAKVSVEGDEPAGIVDAGTLRANEGETISLSSFAGGANWSLNGGTFDVVRVNGIVGGANLVVKDVVPSDEGTPESGIKTYSAAILKGGTLTGAVVNWRLQVVPLPLITGEPVDSTPKPGEEGLVSVGMKATEDTMYQWYYQASPEAKWTVVAGSSEAATPDAKSGADQPTYRIAAVSPQDSGYYRVEATNSAGTVSSRSAHLRVLAPVSVKIVFDGEDNVNPGGTIALLAEGSGDLAEPTDKAFQWYKFGANKQWTVLRDEKGDTLTLSNATEANEGFYRVRAYGVVGGASDSAPVKVTVNDAVTFAGQKTKVVALAAGETITLSVPDAGPEAHYLWYKDGAVAPGIGDVRTLTIRSATSADAGVYGMLLNNAFSVAGETSVIVTGPQTIDIKPFPVAQVTVQAPAQFSQISLVDAGTVTTGALGSVNEGRTLKLRVDITTQVLPLKFQWRRNGVALAGFAGASGAINKVSETVELAIPNVGATNAGLYDVVLSNALGTSVSEPVSVSVEVSPQITKQPVGALVAEGGTAIFQVEASGTALSYQWLLSGSGTDFSAATVVGTEPILSRVSVAASDNGKFLKVIVSKGGGTFTPAVSNVVKLTVTTDGDVAISAETASGLTTLNGASVVLPGRSVAFSAHVVGSGTLSYVWRKDGVDLPDASARGVVGANGNVTYGVVATNTSGGIYDLLVSNGANFAYSKPQTLVVDPKVESMDGPSSANPGDGVRYRVLVTSRKVLRYIWLKNGVALVESANVSGVAGDTLTLKAVSAADAGTYRVEAGYADGSEATLKVVSERVLSVTGVSITKQPVGVTLEGGQSGTLRVEARNATGYKWYKDGVVLSGQTSAALNFGAAAESDSGLYQVEVSNTGGAVLSEIVAVKVNAALGVTIDPVGQVALGSAVSFNATVTGSGTFSYEWTKSGKVVGSQKRLLLSPVLLSDDGTYRLEVKSGSAVASGTVALSVRKVPEILVGPASQVAGSGPVKLFVVARYEGGLSYQWSKNGATMSGETKAVLTIDGAGVGPAGDRYTVRVSAVADTSAYTEASARLSKTGSGSASTELGVTTASKWWVYAVSASGRNWVNGLRDTSADRSGYWMVERVTAGDVEKAARSVFVWSTGVVEWLSADQTALEVRESERGEFSVVGSRVLGIALESYVVSGRLEQGGDAALYGAPEFLDGEYDVEAGLDLSLIWESTETLLLQNAATWTEAVTALRDEFLRQRESASLAPLGD